MTEMIGTESDRFVMEVRRVDSDVDLRRLHDLFAEYEADLPPVLRHGVVPDVEELKDAYSGKNAAFLATLDGSAIGCVAVAALDSELALLLRLFVTPKSRGHGAARSLVSAAVEFLREGGYRRVVLDTHKEQLEPAYRLYRSLGFEECEPYRAVTYDCPTFMELRVWPRHPKT